jgi:uncharacterized protein YndB with AHSA1/START domain
MSITEPLVELAISDSYALAASEANCQAAQAMKRVVMRALFLQIFRRPTYRERAPDKLEMQLLGCCLKCSPLVCVQSGGCTMSQTDQDRIEKNVDLAAPVSRVWRAITDYKEFGQWFNVRLDGPFKVGATTTGNITYPGYEHMKWESLTERMEHERLFAFSWPPSAVDPDTTYDDDAKVVVEFRLQPIQNGTQLTIIESGFLQFPEAKRLEVLRSNKEGWDIQAKNVAAHVAS